MKFFEGGHIDHPNRLVKGRGVVNFNIAHGVRTSMEQNVFYASFITVISTT